MRSVRRICQECHGSQPNAAGIASVQCRCHHREQGDEVHGPYQGEARHLAQRTPFSFDVYHVLTVYIQALSYLIARPSPNAPSQPSQSATRVALSPTSANQRQPSQLTEEPRRMEYSPRTQQGGQSALTIDSYGATPRPARSVSRMSNPYTSVGKRSGTAAAEFMRWNSDAPASPSKMEEHTHTHTHDGEFQLNDDPEDAYDGLENVRACCDGKHDVGALGGRHHHHHHHTQQQQQQQQRGTVRGAPGDSAPERPVSPSGWSFRSGRRV